MKNIHNFTAKTMNTHSVDWQDLVTVSDIHEQMDVESFYIRSEDTKSSTCSGTSHMLCFFLLQIDHAVHAESQTSLGISVSTPPFTRFGNIHHAC
jgi:hypothetical protein